MSFSWQAFAIASAIFAAMTAILAKIGVAQMNSNMATFIRTLVILLVTALIISARAEWQKPSGGSWVGWACLVASGVTTGLSWLCYFRALQLQHQIGALLRKHLGVGPVDEIVRLAVVGDHRVGREQRHPCGAVVIVHGLDGLPHQRLRNQMHIHGNSLVRLCAGGRGGDQPRPRHHHAREKAGSHCACSLSRCAIA